MDFKDDDHLNQRGVDKLMPAFVRILHKHRLLDEALASSAVD
jgi:hypothetical protein